LRGDTKLISVRSHPRRYSWYGKLFVDKVEVHWEKTENHFAFAEDCKITKIGEFLLNTIRLLKAYYLAEYLQTIRGTIIICAYNKTLMHRERPNESVEHIPC